VIGEIAQGPAGEGAGTDAGGIGLDGELELVAADRSGIGFGDAAGQDDSDGFAGLEGLVRGELDGVVGTDDKGAAGCRGIAELAEYPEGIGIDRSRIEIAVEYDLDVGAGRYVEVIDGG
jgi:hypothetical protein